MKTDLYQTVTDRIITALETGTVPWRNPILGRQAAGHPRNLASDKTYRGINVFLLAFTAWEQGYSSSCWLTFKQARERGGFVRKGEKSTVIVFWKQFTVQDRETGKDKDVPVLRYYRVFNVEQCDGIEAPDVEPLTPIDFQPITAAAAVADGYQGPQIITGGNVACYRPSSDQVRIPEPCRFVGAEEYYATLFHELAHSSGHSSRLDRGLDSNPRPFGSPDYSREELIAEMAAAFLCGHAGISPATIGNAAAYIQGWTKALKGDKRLVVQAAGAAQKAADLILHVGQAASS